MQPVHGYDVRRELMAWNADSWGKVGPGSVYHALKKMADEGLLEAVATEQVGNRPARTSYRVTPKGEREFIEQLYRLWWTFQPPYDPYITALAFMPALPRREAAEALRHRAQMLQATLTTTEMAMSAQWLSRKPDHVKEIMALVKARAEAELKWCERVAARIENGELQFSDDAQEA